MGTLYKIMSSQEWKNAVRRGVYEGSEVDRRDGFIHLSAAYQARGTAQRHFAHQQDLVLVAVNAVDLGESLKWEASRGGALFPHVYGTLPLTAVTVAVPLPLVNGTHEFPESIPQ